MPAGRPSEYNFELCKEICEFVASGMPIMKALEQSNKYPSWETFRKWKNENPELLALYTQCRQDKAEAKEWKYEQIMAKLENGELDPATGRVLLDNLRWMMGKYYPKMFGDNKTVDVTSAGEKLDNTLIVKHVDMSKPQ